MTVFKTLFKILNKNKGVIIMYTSIFLGIVLAITNANKPISTDSFKSTRLNVAYYNHSDSELAENLCKFIDENHNVRTDIDENIDAFRDEIYNREVDYIVIIPENFDETKQVETYKLPGSITSQFMKMSVENFITTASAYESLGISKDEVYKKTLETMNLGTSVTITDKSSETDYTPVHYYYSYLPYIFLCVICSTVSIVLISFNKAEVKSRTLCSGLSIGRRNLILTIGCMIFTFFIALFYIIVSLIMVLLPLFVCNSVQGCNIYHGRNVENTKCSYILFRSIGVRISYQCAYLKPECSKHVRECIWSWFIIYLWYICSKTISFRRSNCCRKIFPFLLVCECGRGSL